MTDHQREKLEKLIERQIEADRNSDALAFFKGALIAIAFGLLVVAVLSAAIAHFTD
jgi:hypothetical protein